MFKRRHRSFGIIGFALLATLRPVAAVQTGGGSQQVPEVAVKAALLYNFAKFTEWPTLARGAPIVSCIVGDERIAKAFVEIVGTHTIDEHPLVLGPSQSGSSWSACHILFIADTKAARSAAGLAGVTTLPVLTVSDSKGFAEAGGIIELYASGGQMRFVINIEAVSRSGLRLSSRLLSLATIIRQTRSPSGSERSWRNSEQ